MNNEINVKLNELYTKISIDTFDSNETACEITNIILSEFNKITADTFAKVICKFMNSQLSKEGLRLYLGVELSPDENMIEFLCDFLHWQKFKDLRKRHDIITLNPNDKLVTVIVATYNRKEMLIQAVNSVLCQSYKKIEIVIIDDCSSDGTEQTVQKEYGNISSVVYCKNKVNLGPGLTRLKAYKEACRGSYVVFMDDDDYFIDNNYFLKAVNLHEKEKNLSFVAPNHFIYNYMNNKIDYIDLECPERINKKEYFMNFNQKYIKPIASATMFNKVSLDAVGFEKMLILNDTTLFLRAILDSDAGFINTIGLVYRLHGNNITYHLTCDFIIENLVEKILIEELGVKKFGFKSKEMDKWINKQLSDTILYYLYNSKVKISDCFKLLSFLKTNSKVSYDCLKFKIIKSGLRSLLIKRKSL